MPRSGPLWPLTCGVQDAISPSPSSPPPGSGWVSLVPSGLPRVSWTGNLRLIHAATCLLRSSSMTSCGVR